MQLKECYDVFVGDYESVRQRMPREQMIRKFVLRFLSDPSYELLCSSLESKNYEEAFRAAHSLKGVCQNLGFQRLEKTVSAMTELLRKWNEAQIDEEQAQLLFEQVSEDYKLVVETIGQLDEE